MDDRIKTIFLSATFFIAALMVVSIRYIAF